MSIPKRPTGSDSASDYFQKIYDQSYGPGSYIRDSRTVRISRNHNGIFLKSKVRPAMPSAPVASSSTSIGILTAIFDNYIVLTDIVSGAVVRAAKMYHLRNSIPSEITLDGIKWIFSYTGATLKYQARGKIPSPNPNGIAIEYQRVTKVYQIASGTTPADQISYTNLSSAYAAALNIKTIAGDADVATGTLVTNLEVGPWRLWAKKIDQTTP